MINIDIKKIGAKFFYDELGNVLFATSEMSGGVKVTTLEEDIEMYNLPNDTECIELPWGSYLPLQYNITKIDISTKEPILDTLFEQNTTKTSENRLDNIENTLADYRDELNNINQFIIES